jgi:hypothetical protein
VQKGLEGEGRLTVGWRAGGGTTLTVGDTRAMGGAEGVGEWG